MQPRLKRFGFAEVHAAELPVCGSSGNHTAEGADDGLTVKLTENAIILRQIIRADQRNIHAGHGHDLLNAFDALLRFDLAHHKIVFVAERHVLPAVHLLKISMRP